MLKNKKSSINAPFLRALTARLKIRVFAFKFICILRAGLILYQPIPLYKIFHSSSIPPLYNSSILEFNRYSGVSNVIPCSRADM